VASKKKKKVAKQKTLTPKNLLFIDKYFELKFNGTEAYLQTYLNVKRRGTAAAAATRMLKDVNVNQEVERRKKEMQTASKDIVDRIREEIEHMAFARMGNYLSFGPSGVTLKSSEDMTPEELAAVAEVTETITEHGGSVRFKLHPKKDSLELLMKYYGLIVEKGELTGKDGAPLGIGLVDMRTIIEDIRQAHQAGNLWNVNTKLEDGDL